MTSIFFINHEWTPEENKRHKEAAERAEVREKEQFESSEALNCDRCGILIGYVYDFDLNGSQFYCAECKADPTRGFSH